MIVPCTSPLPTTVRELASYIETEFPSFSVGYSPAHEQLIVVGPPGQVEPPAALREVLASQGTDFLVQDQQVTDRRQWVTIVNAPTAVDVGGRDQP